MAPDGGTAAEAPTARQLRSQEEGASSRGQSTGRWWHGVVAGPVSGLCSRLVVFPLDTLKARLQVQGALPTGAVYTGSTLAAARQMLSSEGPSGFYRGLGAVLWGVVPANAAYFGAYEAGRTVVPKVAEGLSPVVQDMAVGTVAQFLAGAVYTPIDIVKERLQVQPIMGGAYRFHTARAAYGALLRSGSPLRGYWVTNAVWIPWNALYIAGYERCKVAASEGLQQPVNTLPAWAVAACSGSAAAGAAAVTHPFDVVKTRIQVLSATPEGAQLGAVRLAASMLQAEGPGAFFQGLTARVLNIAPGCMISWALYESIKRWLATSTPPWS